MDAIKLDTVVTDTKLAQDFLEKNKKELNSILNNEIIVSDSCNDGNKGALEDGKFKILTRKIEENAELFAQLEALQRNLSIDAVKNFDIKIILQSLKYCSSNRLNIQYPHWFNYSRVMRRDSPLANLGDVGHFIYYGLTINCCKATAAICYLFVQLCGQAGFTTVVLKYSEELENETKVSDSKFACTGVVTEHSDVDSAVDTFLSSTSQHPMKLHRLFIQESVYQRFKKALAWKCNLKQSQSTEDTALSAEVKTYEDKVFIFGYTGTDRIEDTRRVILVETYRNVKELLSILKKSEIFGLSLWCSDVSEANEISFSADIPVVWVNDFGVFAGPDNCSQAYYSYLYYKDGSDFYGTPTLVDNFTKIHESWSTLSLKDRIEKIKQALNKIKSENVFIAAPIADVEKMVLNLESNKFVEIKKDRLCIGVNKSKGIVLLSLSSPISHTSEPFLSILTSIIYGNCVLWTMSLSGPDFLFRFLKLLEKENIPIIDYFHEDLTTKKDEGTQLLMLRPTPLLYRTCVVYMKFGTIFAN